MRIGKDAFDLSERVLLDKSRKLDAAIEHEVERGRIERRRAAPIAERAGVERHQIRKAQLHAIHREADDAERGPEGEEAESCGLSGSGARAFEDEPFGRWQPLSLAKFRNAGFQRL